MRVEVGLAAAPAAVDVALPIATRAGLPERDRRAAHEALRTALTAFFAQLPIREDARVNRLAGLALAVPGVEDVTILSATLHRPEGGVEDRLDAAAGIIALADVPTRLGDLSIADPGLPTRADLAIRFPLDGAVPDRNAVVAAVEAAFATLSAAAATSGGSPDARTLSYGKLLRVLPAPVGGGATLAAYDAAPEPKPVLPTDAGPYEVVLFLAQANGLTRVLQAAADSYSLAAEERLALDAVTVEPLD